ncbi:MAG: homocysteine S-methyltransferase family protein, partial [Campylobacterales bacterium]|nr:homocysteine S-methyltransferase family protein [Campylobacterales bacterium]
IPNEAWQNLHGCNEILNESYPKVIEEIYESYLVAGANVLKTNSFGALGWVLDEYDISHKAYDLAYLSAKLAKNLALKYHSSDNPRFVTGSLGPGTKLPSLGHIEYDEMYEGYKLSSIALIDGGVDSFLIETAQDPLQIKCALNGIFDAMKYKNVNLPVMVSATIELNGTMLIGTDIGTLYTILEPFDIFSIGLNCGTGPKEVKRHIDILSQLSNKPISIHSNAGLPENRGGQTYYPMQPEEFATLQSEFLNFNNVCLLGGCCGTTPEHIKALKAKVQNRLPKKASPEYQKSLASLFQTISLKQKPAPLLIGERSNATGSKAFRELLLKSDYEGALSVAQEQVKATAHVLDVSVAFAGRDEFRDMKEVIKLYSQKIPLPLMPDSTQLNALEVALKNIGGRAIINSANLEDGIEKFDKVCSLAKRYGSALVCLTIDESGMAKTKEKKVEIAKRMYERAVNYHGLSPADLVFDVLTFTIGSGDEEFFTAGVETIEAIRELHTIYPECGSTLGLSNISFGLDKNARVFLNSIFLYHAVEAGLTTAIVNTAHLLPYHKISKEDIEVCEALIFNHERTSKPLFDFINHFSNRVVENKSDENLENLSDEEKIKKYLLDGEKDKMLKLLATAKDTIAPEKIINEILIDGMKTVGELFGNGQMQLPFVLQSAEVMKSSVDYLNQFLEKKDSQSQATLILGTVKGDVHDVGKNLVDIILSNNGYKVVNIGIKADIEKFIEALSEHKADAIGMSGLLVKSTQVMKENLIELKNRGINVPILLGGAALNKKFVDEYCRTNYDGAIFYCRDAFDGLNAMNMIEKGELEHLPTIEDKQDVFEESFEDVVIDEKDIVKPKSVEIPKAPFYGRFVLECDDFIKNISFDWLNHRMLFKQRWGYSKKNLSESDYNKLLNETIMPNFLRLKELFLNELFLPTIIYGYYPCIAKDDILYIFDENYKEQTPNIEKAIHKITFPRQRKKPHRSVADYFSDKKLDVVAFSVVSSGLKLSEYESKLFKDGLYHEYYLVHGLGVELAESLAEIVHKKVRAELNILRGERDSLDDVK